jgi:hypothetical protein
MLATAEGFYASLGLAFQVRWGCSLFLAFCHTKHLLV